MQESTSIYIYSLTTHLRKYVKPIEETRSIEYVYFLPLIRNSMYYQVRYFPTPRQLTTRVDNGIFREYL